MRYSRLQQPQSESIKQQGRLIIDDLKRHYRMLKECIAISQSGYIIKESYGNSFRYRDINVGELRAILDFSTTLTLEVEKKNEETSEMEKKEVRVSFKPIKEIQSGELRTQLAYYHKTDLFTDEEGHHIETEHLEPHTARFTRCLGVQDALFLSPPHITLTLPKP